MARYLLQMLQLGYFEIAYNENNHLKITETGRKVLFGKEKALLAVVLRENFGPNKKRHNNAKSTKKNGVPASSVAKTQISLFNHLKALRLKLANQEAMPAYIVLSDKVLHDIAATAPLTVEEFGKINGIGEFKKKKYGKDFVNAILLYQTGQE